MSDSFLEPRRSPPPIPTNHGVPVTEPSSRRESHVNLCATKTRDQEIEELKKNPVPERPPARDCMYILGRELGKGTYSVVRETVHTPTGKYYAAKVINKRLMRGREFLVRNEIVVLRRVSKNQPYILSLVDYFETEHNLYLITELARGGELFERLYSSGTFYESDAARIIKQVASGVAHLHEHGIVHRDLKPENLLFKTNSDDSPVLICDFGLSRIIDEEKFRILMTTCGTPSYMAPEVFTKSGHGKPVDIWAIGVITYFLMCGYVPFDRENPVEEREAILKGEFKFEPTEYWIHATRDCIDFIQTCLKLDPLERPTAKQCLEHRFLTKKYRSSRSLEADLLPSLLSNLSTRHDSVMDIPSTLEGDGMNGAYSKSPSERSGDGWR